MKNRKQPLFKSFGYAFEGIWTGISKERNMKIHCLAVILVTAVGTFVGLTPMEWCICLLLFGMAAPGGDGAARRKGRFHGGRRLFS